jgi:hypothetical protein
MFITFWTVRLYVKVKEKRTKTTLQDSQVFFIYSNFDLSFLYTRCKNVLEIGGAKNIYLKPLICGSGLAPAPQNCLDVHVKKGKYCTYVYEVLQGNKLSWSRTTAYGMTRGRRCHFCPSSSWLAPAPQHCVNVSTFPTLPWVSTQCSGAKVRLEPQYRGK